MSKLTGGPNIPFRPFNVMTFDPGGTTGWAHAWCNEKPKTMSDIHLRVGELGPNKELHHDDLYELMSCTDKWSSEVDPPSYAKLEFVTEPFEFRQFARQEGDDIGRTKVELISCEYIGVMELYCYRWNSTLYRGFNAGEAKSYVPNMKLEKIGWLQTPQHPKRHINDALRQLVKYLIVKKHIRHPISTLWTDDNSE